LRHAGRFGFDFGAAEWFHDTTRNRCVVRIAVPDLPTPLWDQVARAVVQWWSVHEEQKFRGRLAHECACIGNDGVPSEVRVSALAERERDG
jgi:hypothetical protein